MRREAATGLMALGLWLTLLCQPAGSQTDLPLEKIQLPPGFSISVYTDDVPGARSMTLSSNGTLYVGTRATGSVYGVVDLDGDGVADRVHVVASGLNFPNGVAWREGSLYVAEVHRLLRYDGIDGQLDDPPEPVVIRDDFPTERLHGWKFIRFGPDGRLYFQIGAPCNTCLSDNPAFATISRMMADGTRREIFAHGVRNSVGFDWHPQTGELWFTDNGRDRMGDDIPADELNRAPGPGLHFGYPFCHGGDVADPEYGQRRSCAEFVPPVQKLNPHGGSIGMRFYTGSMFPEGFRDQIFIAEHGSWDRSEKIGYRVSLVRLRDGRPVSFEGFAEGWLERGDSWGRPVDVQVMPDGALLVSDDRNGVIYRISYSALE